MSKKTVLLISITIMALIAGGLFGYYKGYYEGKDIGIDKGWQLADERLEEIGFINKAARIREVKFINGEVKSVGENSIEVEIRPLLPLADPDLDIRIIEINENTEIIKIEKIPTKLSSDGFVNQEKKVDISAAEPGQFISITSGVDIKEAKTFGADKIIIFSQQ